MPKDVVCGMIVPEDTEYKLQYQGKTYYFCCEDCLNEFKANPSKYVSKNKF
jgi:YHS domain-containing protein